MKVKVKHILVILIIVILVVSSVTIIYRKNSKKEINEVEKEQQITENISETQRKTIWDYDDPDELVYVLAKKNGDWSDLPLSDEFKSKYNEKDGILGNIQYDNIEYKPKINNDYFTDRTYLVITQGLKKTIYLYSLCADVEALVEDVRFHTIIPYFDENGKMLDIRQPITKDNFGVSFNRLAFGFDDEKGVAVTDAFHKKYPYFLDLFIHYSPIGANSIKFIENKSNFDKREVYFEIDSKYECKKRTYKVKFKLDGRGYLDDATAELLKEEFYDREKLSDAGNIIFYKKSNWNNLKLSKKFKDKFSVEDGTFPDIDLIDYNIIGNPSIKYKNNKIKSYIYKDGKLKFFYCNYIYNKDNYLDDVEYLPIEYTGTDPNEALEAYKKQYEQN